MKRDIYKKLINWKNQPNPKPLLLSGARQTGKTYLLKEFAQNEYKKLIYCNFEEEPLLSDLFKQDIKPEKIIEQLSIYKRTDINPDSDLIFFDEIQQSGNALNSLKYFNEEKPEYHIIAAGSLLGLKLSSPHSFPVGKVFMLSLYPMTFPEFLDAAGESKLRGMLETINSLEPVPEPFHQKLINLLKTYYIVGGMPEAIKVFIESGSYNNAREIQNNIQKAYIFDFARHAPRIDISRLSLIWESIPVHLSKENKKFIFTAVEKSARAMHYENALKWLEDAGLIYKSYAVSTIQKPLSGFKERNIFKVFTLDTGLLSLMSYLSIDVIQKKNELFTTYKGAFIENYIAQQLAAGENRLYYWKSTSGKAEIDFIFENADSIYPLEAKAGINPKSKSLAVYDEKFNPPFLLRTTLLNLKKEKRVLNIPLYAVNYIEKFLKLL